MSVLVLATLGCGQASAQIAGGLSLQNNYQVRGKSITQDRPVGILDLSYDFPSGFYVNGSAFGALPDHSRPGLLGTIGDVGYAKRLNLLLSIDGGVTRSEYIGVGEDGYSTGYTEIYAGLSSRHLSARLYYSPDYFKPGAETLYGEVEGNIGLTAGVRLNAHLGSLAYLSDPAGVTSSRTQFDWLVGVSRQFGAIDLHAAVYGGAPDQPYGYGQPRFRTQIIVGAGYTF